MELPPSLMHCILATGELSPQSPKLGNTASLLALPPLHAAAPSGCPTAHTCVSSRCWTFFWGHVVIFCRRHFAPSCLCETLVGSRSERASQSRPWHHCNVSFPSSPPPSLTLAPSTHALRSADAFASAGMPSWDAGWL